ncbi:MAG: alpha-L-fucosidase [Mangrovibacterium sp.]
MAKPTDEQLAFQDLELGVFIHYSIDAYTRNGFPPGTTPASAFNPTKLNVEQWVVAAKNMGATYVVLTARHEQGFCLWPTKTTDYSIKSSPYKNGEGDIVLEFVEACRKYELKPGLYTAPWIDSHWEAGKGIDILNSGDIYKLDEPDLYQQALQKEKTQLEELLTNYGPLVFVWDDHFGRSDALDEVRYGGKLREFYAAFTQYAHELQPDCLFLGRDVEHVGTEEGRASYPLWNALNTIDGTIYSVSETYRWGQANIGNPEGKFYKPQLSCTTDALSSGGWMWHGPRMIKPLERTMQTYYETIGRGAGLIVNLVPDTTGLIPENLILAANAFGDEIKRRFENPVAVSEIKDPAQLIRFDTPLTFNHVVTMEDLHNGQKIAKYKIEAEIDGEWKTIVEGQTIGHKRIDHFEPVNATAMRFEVTDAIAKPVMRSIEIFNVTDL